MLNLCMKNLKDIFFRWIYPSGSAKFKNSVYIYIFFFCLKNSKYMFCVSLCASEERYQKKHPEIFCRLLRMDMNFLPSDNW